ncbi:taste receptor type 1 member 1-like isoform X1 [Erpetoichthys calabaricus]|uniref:taste receptor type 1 member 1-like isoform X1 n=1 Tax=Erpetoichthys calabaricus TaxID=27687 RepID=UPI002234CE3A|nr:taste receptor type 1 member 1-like isoform X1 [Erpetoichthys calabaricus]
MVFSPFNWRNVQQFLMVEAMRFAVDEINNSSNILPNITLGYQLLDNCSMEENFHSILHLLSDTEVDVLYVWHDPSKYLPTALAIIGPGDSTAATAIMGLPSWYWVPVIDFFDSVQMLANKRLYPSYFCTVPSTLEQTRAILRLMQRFSWTWVAIVGSSTDYGQESMQLFLDMSATYGVCVPYLHTITTSPQDTMRILAEIMAVNVTVIFAEDTVVESFFQVAVNQSIEGKVWVASNTWSVSTRVAAVSGILKTGTVLGIAVKERPMPGFEEYLSKKFQSPAPHTGSNGLMTSCMGLTAKQILSYTGTRVSYGVYAAVHAASEALNLALGCKPNLCERKRIYPWQVLNAMKTMNFSISNVTGDPNRQELVESEYDIITWHATAQLPSVTIVGHYSRRRGLKLNKTLIGWGTIGQQVEWGRMGVLCHERVQYEALTGVPLPFQEPFSVCSEECSLTARKERGSQKCCFQCIPCAPGMFTNKSNPYTCQSCNVNEWWNPFEQRCLKREVEFLRWSDPAAMLLTCVSWLAVILTLGIIVLFLWYQDTPVVKATGGRMSLVMLVCLTVAYVNISLYIGKPFNLVCLIRHPIYAITSSICLSCMAVKSFQLVCIFKLARRLPSAYNYWAHHSGPVLTIVGFTVVDIIIQVTHCILTHPKATVDTSSFPDLILLNCSHSLQLLDIFYKTLLSLLAFLLAYLSKDLPPSYSEVRCIAFSALIFLVGWGFYLTVHVLELGRLSSVLKVLSILLSLLGITAGYFLPRCYIILIQPERNTATFFQNMIHEYTMGS